MVSKKDLRNNDKLAGFLIVTLLFVGSVSGVILGNWSIFDTLIDDTTFMAVFLVLMYRLVVAVEGYVFED